MSKSVKIILVVLVIVVIAGAVFIKYIKPKMDEKKELKRLKEADLISRSAKTVETTSNEQMVASIVSENPVLIGIGGTVVK